MKSEQYWAFNVIVHCELYLRGFSVSGGQVPLGCSLNRDTQTQSSSEKETTSHVFRLRLNSLMRSGPSPLLNSAPQPVIHEYLNLRKSTWITFFFYHKPESAQFILDMKTGACWEIFITHRLFSVCLSHPLCALITSEELLQLIVIIPSLMLHTHTHTHTHTHSSTVLLGSFIL